MRILNLTQHNATEEQVKAGVFEPKNKELVRQLLTFNEIPTEQEILDRADKLTEIALDEGADATMIGGVPFLMSSLEEYLKLAKVKPLYAFSKRISEDVEKDGVVTKISKFVFEGFVEAP